MGYAVLLAKPAARVDVEELRGSPGPLLQLGRQRGEQLQPRGRELTAEPELGRGADEERFGLGAVETGELRPVAALEAVAAGRSPDRDDRNPCLGESLRVALNGPLGDLEPLGEVDRRQLTARLQEEQKRHEPARAHVSSLIH